MSLCRSAKDVFDDDGGEQAVDSPGTLTGDSQGSLGDGDDGGDDDADGDGAGDGDEDAREARDVNATVRHSLAHLRQPSLMVDDATARLKQRRTARAFPRDANGDVNVTDELAQLLKQRRQTRLFQGNDGPVGRRWSSETTSTIGTAAGAPEFKVSSPGKHSFGTRRPSPARSSSHGGMVQRAPGVFVYASPERDDGHELEPHYVSFTAARSPSPPRRTGVSGGGPGFDLSPEPLHGIHEPVPSRRPVNPFAGMVAYADGALESARLAVANAEGGPVVDRAAEDALRNAAKHRAQLRSLLHLASTAFDGLTQLRMLGEMGVLPPRPSLSYTVEEINSACMEAMKNPESLALSIEAAIQAATPVVIDPGGCLCCGVGVCDVSCRPCLRPRVFDVQCRW